MSEPSLQAVFAEFKAGIDLARAAGACGLKGRYFANKQVYKRLGVNVFDLLEMTRKSKPTRDEILYVVTESEGGVTPADILTEYPFVRLNVADVVQIFEQLEKEGLIYFDGEAYRGV